jgi:hypothetical protein
VAFGEALVGEAVAVLAPLAVGSPGDPNCRIPVSQPAIPSVTTTAMNATTHGHAERRRESVFAIMTPLWPNRGSEACDRARV